MLLQVRSNNTPGRASSLSILTFHMVYSLADSDYISL